jgi:hypothetical protein
MEEPEPNPLNYQIPPKRPIGRTWLGIIGLAIYAAGLGACWFIDPSDLFGAMVGWSMIYCFPVAIIAGIKFGTQEKDYWV